MTKYAAISSLNTVNFSSRHVKVKIKKGIRDHTNIHPGLEKKVTDSNAIVEIRTTKTRIKPAFSLILPANTRLPLRPPFRSFALCERYFYRCLLL